MVGRLAFGVNLLDVGYVYTGHPFGVVGVVVVGVLGKQLVATCYPPFGSMFALHLVAEGMSCCRRLRVAGVILCFLFLLARRGVFAGLLLRCCLRVLVTCCLAGPRARLPRLTALLRSCCRFLGLLVAGLPSGGYVICLLPFVLLRMLTLIGFGADWLVGLGLLGVGG